MGTAGVASGEQDKDLRHPISIRIWTASSVAVADILDLLLCTNSAQVRLLWMSKWRCMLHKRTRFGGSYSQPGKQGSSVGAMSNGPSVTQAVGSPRSAGQRLHRPGSPVGCGRSSPFQSDSPILMIQFCYLQFPRSHQRKQSKGSMA